MLKQLLKRMLSKLRRQLLRIPRIHAAVADYKHRAKKKRHHERWAEQLRKSGGMVR